MSTSWDVRWNPLLWKEGPGAGSLRCRKVTMVMMATVVVRMMVVMVVVMVMVVMEASCSWGPLLCP